jgi:hypothetical protein
MIQVGVVSGMEATTIDPVGNTPMLIRDNLVDASCIRGIGSRALELFAKLAGAEEDPVVLISTVELVFELSDGIEHSREVILMSECH